MTTRVTERGARHVGGFLIFSFAVLLVVSAVVSVVGGMLFLVPAILIVGPMGLAMWWVFHERTLPDEISPAQDHRRGP